MNPTSSTQFVIAHYNEDLTWVDPIIQSTIIYTKGSFRSTPYPDNTLTLPNIGREGHTYLHHIVSQYESLAEITVFLQGRIDDHISLLPREIEERARHTEPGDVTTFPWRELEIFDCWDGIPWADYPCWEKWSAMRSKQAPKTPGQYIQGLLHLEKVPESIGFQPGALFAVHRDTIRMRPLSMYKELLKEFFLGEMAHVNPETGHYMERFWLALWKPKEYICWDKTGVSLEERNRQGQLARGRWHRTPKGVRVDSYISTSPSFNELNSSNNSGSESSS